MRPEEWRPVPGHPLLEASNLGRVRSLPYSQPMPKGGFKRVHVTATFGVRTSSRKGAAHCYMKLTFKRQNFKVHRLVCLAFHGEPPPDKPLVLHGDEDGCNNEQDNLAWGSQKENLNAPGFIAYCRSRTGENSPSTKAKRMRELV